VVRVVWRAHQRRHRAKRPGDALPVLTKRGEHHSDSGIVVERVEERLHPGLQFANGPVVVPQLCRPAALPAVGGRALEIAEDDIEDVDDVVPGARGEHVDEDDQRGHPPLRGQVGQLGGPCILGVAGQAGHPAGRQSRQVEAADTQPADLAEALQRLNQTGDRGTERRPP
jgi:hypothetical protein